jgi:hypothetical protein
MTEKRHFTMSMWDVHKKVRSEAWLDLTGDESEHNSLCVEVLGQRYRTPIYSGHPLVIPCGRLENAFQKLERDICGALEEQGILDAKIDADAVQHIGESGLFDYSKDMLARAAYQKS